MRLRLHVLTIVTLGVASATMIPPSAALAETVTRCTVSKFCYCVHRDLLGAVSANVRSIRTAVRTQREMGKSVGYMSIPISTISGSYIGVNAAVAEQVKSNVEAHLGPSLAWLLNPAASGVELPKGANGADYMLMWTQVLEGEDGLGRDFDFVYFVGPKEFIRYFRAAENAGGDMERVAAYYDSESIKDAKLRDVDRMAFIRYYALRASVSFSLGSHDEWNILRSINVRRRAPRNAAHFGIPGQLPAFFNGEPIAPALLESAVAPGDAGACKR